MPEIASRAHLERDPAGDPRGPAAGRIRWPRSDAVAVANTPGLAGSLLVGLAAAKALCVARDIPLVAVNHLQAHIYACRLAAAPQEVFPCVGLIVSGGHTSLYRCLGPLDFELLGPPSTTPPARPSTKWPRCWACPIRAGRPSRGPPPGGNPRGLRPAPLVLPGRRAAGFQFQRPEDGGALHDRRAGPARFQPLGTGAAASGRPGGQFPGGGGGLPGRTRRLRPCGNRAADLCAWAGAWRPMSGCAAASTKRPAARRPTPRRPAAALHRQCRDGAPLPWSGSRPGWSRSSIWRSIRA